MPLRYMRSVQLGAYMWRKGLNCVKTGSKWIYFTYYLCTPHHGNNMLEIIPRTIHGYKFCPQYY